MNKQKEDVTISHPLFAI